MYLKRFLHLPVFLYPISYVLILFNVIIPDPFHQSRELYIGKLGKGPLGKNLSCKNGTSYRIYFQHYPYKCPYIIPSRSRTVSRMAQLSQSYQCLGERIVYYLVHSCQVFNLISVSFKDSSYNKLCDRVCIVGYHRNIRRIISFILNQLNDSVSCLLQHIASKFQRQSPLYLRPRFKFTRC